MNQIIEQIWIGNSHDGLHSKEKLKSNGITAILNCAFDLENKISYKYDGILVAHCGLIDSNQNSNYFLLSAYYQLKGMVETGHKILVFCHEGKSRSVGIVCYYLSKENNITFDEAYQMVSDKRKEANINSGIKEKLTCLLSDAQFVGKN